MSDAVDYLSLDGLVTENTKSWGGGPSTGLPPGEYLVKVVGKEKKTPEGKTPQLEVQFQVTDDTVGGQHKDRKIRNWYYLTPDAIGRLTCLLGAMGLQLDKNKGLSLDAMMNQEVVIGVFEDKFGGEANPLGGTTETKTRSKVYNERPRSEWGAVKEKAQTKK